MMKLDKPQPYYSSRPTTIYNRIGDWSKQYFDHYGRIIKVVNSNGAWMTKKWDENNLIQRVYSDGSWEEWEYNNNGDLIKSKWKSASNNSEIKTLTFTYP